MACLFSPIHYISKSKWSTYFSSFFFSKSQTRGCIDLYEGGVITIAILQGDILLALFTQLISGGAGMWTRGFGFWKLHRTPWPPRKSLGPSFLYPFWSFSNRPLSNFPFLLALDRDCISCSSVYSRHLTRAWNSPCIHPTFQDDFSSPSTRNTGQVTEQPKMGIGN